MAVSASAFAVPGVVYLANISATVVLGTSLYSTRTMAGKTPAATALTTASKVHVFVATALPKSSHTSAVNGGMSPIEI